MARSTAWLLHVRRKEEGILIGFGWNSCIKSILLHLRDHLHRCLCICNCRLCMVLLFEGWEEGMQGGGVCYLCRLTLESHEAVFLAQNTGHLVHHTTRSPNHQILHLQKTHLMIIASFSQILSESEQQIFAKHTQAFSLDWLCFRPRFLHSIASIKFLCLRKQSSIQLSYDLRDDCNNAFEGCHCHHIDSSKRVQKVDVISWGLPSGRDWPGVRAPMWFHKTIQLPTLRQPPKQHLRRRPSPQAHLSAPAEKCLL